jgi:hypothetical protein
MRTARLAWLLSAAAACAPPGDDPAMPGGPGSGGTLGGGDSGVDEHRTDWLQDNWSVTAEICDFPEPFVWPETEDGNGSDLYWSLYLYDDPACAEAIQADLGMDTTSFGITDHASIDREDYRPQTTMYLRMVYHAWTLMARNAGTLSDLQSPYNTSWGRWGASDSFRFDIEEAGAVLGQTEVRQIVYNIVTSSIRELRYGGYDEDSLIEAEVSTDGSRVMTIYGSATSRGMSIVHEAAHLYRDERHVECPDIIGQHWTGYGSHLPGLLACDEDRSGAWGFEVALYTSYYEHWPDTYPHESDWGTWDGGYGGFWTWAAQDKAIPIISEWTEEDGYWNSW